MKGMPPHKICSMSIGSNYRIIVFTTGSTGYQKSTNSFLFSLRNKDNLKHFQSLVYQNSANAIYQNPGYGPTFGGGNDVIYTERESVLYHGIKTPRSVLKNEAVGRVF